MSSILAVTGDIGAFRKQLAREMARLDREISKAYYDWTKTVMTRLVRGSAQWSGNYAHNWNYSVGGPDYSYTQAANKTGDDARINYQSGARRLGVFQAGDDPAVSDALSRMTAVKPPTWRDQVFITNMTETDDHQYMAEAIDRIKLRPVNLVQGHVVSISYLMMNPPKPGDRP